MTRTGALLEEWHINPDSVARKNRPYALALVRFDLESRERHQHKNNDAFLKCGACVPALTTPYDIHDFPGDLTAERIIVSWLGDLEHSEHKYGHGRLLGWFGADRFVDLCYAVAHDYGVGPFADSGGPGRRERATSGAERSPAIASEG